MPALPVSWLNGPKLFFTLALHRGPWIDWLKVTLGMNLDSENLADAERPRGGGAVEGGDVTLAGRQERANPSVKY